MKNPPTILFVSSNDGSDMRINKEVRSLHKHSEVIFFGVGDFAKCYVAPFCKRVILVKGKRNSVSVLAKQILIFSRLVLTKKISSIHIINEQLYVFFFPLLFFKHTVLDLFDSIFLKKNRSGENLNWIKKIVYLPANWIMVTDENRYNLMPKSVQPKCLILPNYPEYLELTEPKRESAELRILYNGWMGLNRGTEIVEGLLKTSQPVKIYMAGWFSDEYTRQLVLKYVDKIEYMGVIPQETALKLAKAEADYILCVYAPINDNNVNASPNKVFDAILTQTPLIINAEVKISEWVRKKGIGYILQKYDAENFEDLFHDLTNRKRSFIFDSELRRNYIWSGGGGKPFKSTFTELKVLFCTNTFEKISNGPSKFAHLLLNESRHAGFETRILTEEVSVEMSGVYKLDLKIPKFLRVFGQFIRMWKYHKAAMKIRKEFEFDYLVYNNAMIGLVSARVFGRTVGMINDDNNALNSLVAALKGNAKFNKRVIFNFVEYVTCHMSKVIIVNSEYLKRNLAQHYYCKDSLFKVMHKGIENNLVLINREEILSNKIPGSVLFVKTDFLRGGLFTLIAAIKDLDHEIKLCVIGVAEEYHDQVKLLLDGTKVSYELYSYIPPDIIFKKMGESEIFCVPSKLEAFGVANLEAMSMACKIVSTNIGGIPEAVGGDRFAWLVEPDNPIALRQALQRALNSSIKDQLNDISIHLRSFSSVNIISRFKSILETCF